MSNSTPDELFHYTDKTGYDAISSQPTWCFKAVQPPPDHNPVGAYFTPLGPETKKLAKRLYIPNSKLKRFFHFKHDPAQPLQSFQSNRGRQTIDIVYSPVDYYVVRDRQIDHGERQ